MTTAINDIIAKAQGGLTYLSQKEVAKLLNLSHRTLESWRVRGTGPRYIRISTRCIRYTLASVMEWQTLREQSSTSMNGVGNV